MTNTRDLGKKLNVQINYSVGPNVISCKQCRLSSYLTPQYVCSFVVSQRPPYLMVSVTVTTYWYDNYGLAVLQLQGLMPSWRFVGLLTLRISALITAIPSVTSITTVTVTVAVAAMSLAQQVHTAQYVDTMSENISLALATQKVVDRKREVGVDALEEGVMHVGTEL